MLAVVPHDRVGLPVPCPKLSTGRVQLFHPCAIGGKEEEDVGVPHACVSHIVVDSLPVVRLRDHHGRRAGSGTGYFVGGRG